MMLSFAASFELSGDFCPVSLSLFHGTRTAALLTVASMTTLLSGEGKVSLQSTAIGDTRPEADLRQIAKRTLQRLASATAFRPFQLRETRPQLRAPCRWFRDDVIPANSLGAKRNGNPSLQAIAFSSVENRDG
jgi:hypothetical protein